MRVILFFLLAVTALTAHAAQSTATLTVSLTITASCTTTATGATVTTQCTQPVPQSVTTTKAVPLPDEYKADSTATLITITY